VDQPASYELFCFEGWPERLLDDGPAKVSPAEARVALGASKQDISNWFRRWQSESFTQARAAGYQRPPESEALLNNFPAFRYECFKLTGTGGRVAPGSGYYTPAFQRRWAFELEQVLDAAGTLLILAPPRHGKTEFVGHKLIQLMIRNPDLRVMWVSLNRETAGQTLSLVKRQFEDNTRLRELFLPPGRTFKPARSSTWSASSLTLATRTEIQKSPTLVAVGRTGGLLSRDADLIVLDDIINDASTMTKERRENDLRWFRTQVVTRRDDGTAMVVIGSRQHYDDIYSTLLADEGNARVVDAAHNEAACRGEHPDPGPGAVSNCLLFPELRSFESLQDREREVGRELYEMVYLNRPRTSGSMMFDPEVVKACINSNRRIGLDDISPDCRLVAGLDPATKGYQAAVLWAFDPTTQRQYLVDLDNTKAAGISGALSLMRQWYRVYGLRYWVLEDNAAQHAYLQDRETREWSQAEGVTIRPHTTGVQKWDRNIGVSAMARLMERGLVDLPFAGSDPTTRDKVSMLTAQLLSFESQPIRKETSDLVMAAWFPQETMRRWRVDHLTVAEITRDPQFPWAAPYFPDNTMETLVSVAGGRA
jgi:hypothetical protein